MNTTEIVLCDYINEDFIKEKTSTLWGDPNVHGGKFERYPYMSPKAKGELGEMIVKSIMRKSGYTVIKAPFNGPYDLLINDIKVEVKTSFAHTDPKKNCLKPFGWIINHVAAEKDWQRLLFLGVNPYDFVMKWISKHQFETYFRDKYFSHQQNGKNSLNDDYMVSNRLVEMLTEMQDISEW